MFWYIIGIGSSGPSRKQNVDQAMAMLKASSFVKKIRFTSFHHNPAVGGNTMQTFLNGAAKIVTPLAPDPFWFHLSQIENSLGRIRLYKDGPRTIDLDVLISNVGHFNSKWLTLPHPRLKDRPFVLKPIKELGHPV